MRNRSRRKINRQKTFGEPPPEKILLHGKRLAFACNLHFGNIRVNLGIAVNIFIEHTLRVFARRRGDNISFIEIRKTNFGSKIFFHFSCPPSACSRYSLNNARTDSLSKFEKFPRLHTPPQPPRSTNARTNFSRFPRCSHRNSRDG